jgi:hypothetical protein
MDRSAGQVNETLHNAHRLILKGESLHKVPARRQKLDAKPIE